ncbi:hypothetical protein [Flavobacterium lindanitolerans]|uniref:Uncharacterized protein n=1 Tax=Flavobacterium lindanitolerans TaxID=428988 RepID=A0A497UP60_9FLAO|nr:hypothetical protein [Flavobacterium lindanitolerans]PKW21127.1 hypothetical protein B0G92_2411 [Flavobacterium lindanitolerans]RLJ30235.1 hypothetical protein CLV50_1639 [Flavobacterium lindanitolerans]
MEKFREAIIILFASYEIKYSLEKGRSKDKTEHFVFVQSFLQEFEENLESFAQKYFKDNNFSPEAMAEGKRYMEKIIEKLASKV